MTDTILILEDDQSLRTIISDEFNDYGLVVTEANAIKDVEIKNYTYALLDLKVQEKTSLELINKLKEANPECKIVVYTGYGSIVTAVEAMREGALNYLIKPVSFDDILKAFQMEVKESLKTEKKLKRPSLSVHEHEYIQYVLNENKGNISKTARELGLHRQSLQRKLKKLPF